MASVILFLIYYLILRFFFFFGFFRLLFCSFFFFLSFYTLYFYFLVYVSNLVFGFFVSLMYTYGLCMFIFVFIAIFIIDFYLHFISLSNLLSERLIDLPLGTESTNHQSLWSQFHMIKDSTRIFTGKTIMLRFPFYGIASDRRGLMRDVWEPRKMCLFYHTSGTH